MGLLRLTGTIVLLAVLVPTSAVAGLDIDFGADIRLGDQTDLYVAISSRYFDHDRHSVATLRTRYSNPDDLAVVLFISRHSGRSPDAIHRLRGQGLSWWDISIRLGLPIDVWFVPVARDPGPPYGKAYGHWKKRRSAVVLQDADVRNLVAVRVLHEYYDVPVEVAMSWRADGRRLPVLLSEEYARRHGGSKNKRSGDPGHGKGKGHGKGRGKGHK